MDLRNEGLGSVKRIRVRVHGVGAQIELVRVRDCRTQDEFGVASSLELDRRLRCLEHREVSGAQWLGGHHVPSANGDPAHRLSLWRRIAPTFASRQPDEERQLGVRRQRDPELETARPTAVASPAAVLGAAASLHPLHAGRCRKDCLAGGTVGRAVNPLCPATAARGPELPGWRRHPFQQMVDEGLDEGREVSAARIDHMDRR